MERTCRAIFKAGKGFLLYIWYMNYSQIGLLLDIAGVLVLFKYGLPSKVRPVGGLNLGESEEDKKERENLNSKIVIKARIGLTLLILGFVFQFYGSMPNGHDCQCQSKVELPK